MADIIEFKKKEPTDISEFVLEVGISKNSQGLFEIYMDLGEETTDFEAYTALEALVAKFAVDTGIWEEEDERVWEMDLEDDN